MQEQNGFKTLECEALEKKVSGDEITMNILCIHCEGRGGCIV